MALQLPRCEGRRTRQAILKPFFGERPYKEILAVGRHPEAYASLHCFVDLHLEVFIPVGVSDRPSAANILHCPGCSNSSHLNRLLSPVVMLMRLDYSSTA